MLRATYPIISMIYIIIIIIIIIFLIIISVLYFNILYKALKPEYKKLAEEFKDVSNVKILCQIYTCIGFLKISILLYITVATIIIIIHIVIITIIITAISIITTIFLL